MDKSQLISEIVDLQRQTGQILGHYAAGVWIDSGLTVRELKSLLLISSKGSTNFRKLAEILGVTPSNVTGIIDSLVEKELVSRTEDMEDRRVMILQATDKGRTLLANFRENAMNHMTQILTLLDLEELSALDQGLSAFIRAAKSYKGRINK